MPIIPYPYTEQTAREHARIWPAVATSGTMIGSYNVIVAATALKHGSEVTGLINGILRKL